jgi:hypothetical protein
VPLPSSRLMASFRRLSLTTSFRRLHPGAFATVAAALIGAFGACGGDPVSPPPDGPTENLSAQLLVVLGLMRQSTDAEILADVRVTGPGNAPRPGAVVTITADTPGASVVNGVITAGADGIARGALLKIGSSLGSYSFSATASPSYSSSPYTITIAAVSEHPAQIERVAGDGQFVTAGGMVRTPAKVRVTDAAGRIVPNARGASRHPVPSSSRPPFPPQRPASPSSASRSPRHSPS